MDSPFSSRLAPEPRPEELWPEGRSGAGAAGPGAFWKAPKCPVSNVSKRSRNNGPHTN